MPELCHIYLVLVSIAESVNLTFGNGVQNVQIYHSDSEIKKFTVAVNNVVRHLTIKNRGSYVTGVWGRVTRKLPAV